MAVSRQRYWGADQIWQSYKEESMAQSTEEKGEKWHKDNDMVLENLFGSDL